MQTLDKKSVLFLRPYKGIVKKTWDVLPKNYKCFEKLRPQKLVPDLTTLKLNTNETVIYYLTGAEEIQYNSEQVNEGLSEKTLTSIISEGLL